MHPTFSVFTYHRCELFVVHLLPLVPDVDSHQPAHEGPNPLLHHPQLLHAVPTRRRVCHVAFLIKQ